jgi:hypothetical protein
MSKMRKTFIAIAAAAVLWPGVMATVTPTMAMQGFSTCHAPQASPDSTREPQR